MEWKTVLDVARERTVEWMESLVAMLPSLVAAGIVLTMFAVVGRMARPLLARALVRVTGSTEVAGVLSKLAYLIVLVAGAFLTLEILNLDKTVTSLLAGVGIVGLALGFAFQDLAANFMAGVLIAFRRPYEIGDVVETHGVQGTVEETTLRATRIRTFEGQLVRLPNRKIIENAITNYFQRGERRVDLEVGVSYGDDLERVKQVAVRAIEGIELRNSNDVELYYTGFGDSSIDFSVRFWIDYPGTNFLEARSLAVQRIKRAFDEAGITIPFPIRTIDFDGVVGSDGLGEILGRSPVAVNGG